MHLDSPRGPVVGDAADLVRPDLVALHDPLHDGLAIVHIVMGCLRVMRNRYPRVILDGRLVLLVWEAYLLLADFALSRAAGSHITRPALLNVQKLGSFSTSGRRDSVFFKPAKPPVAQRLVDGFFS